MASKSARYRAKLKAKKLKERLRKGRMTTKRGPGKRLHRIGMKTVRRRGGVPK